MLTFRRSVAAGAILAAVALSGCAGLSQKRLDFAHTEDARITQIVIEPGAGDVVVRTADRDDAEIKRTVRYWLDEPSGTGYRVDGDTLSLDTDCGRRCAASFELTVPRGVGVRGENGSGNVQLTDVAAVDVEVGSGTISVNGASGTVRARTGSGDVSVSGGSGEVELRAGSGSIRARQLGAEQVRVETGSGDIEVDLRRPGSVRAEASSGSVELTVPAGRYRVDAQSRSGTERVDVPHDAAAAHLLEIRTGRGDVTVRER